MNMSLSTANPSDGRDALSQAVNAAVDAGIIAVVSAGNSGPDAFTVGAPAAAEKAITVCAMRDPGESGWSLGYFSSRGPALDGRIKPDICAPGVRITSVMAGTTDRYVAYSGTSMSSPYVAGVVALMLEANPYLTVADVKEYLYDTAQDWGRPGRDNEYGYGRVNAYRAVQRVLGLPGVGPANPTHAVGRGVVEEGGEAWYKLNVTDTTKPVAATLVLDDSATEYYDFDLYLYDEEGNELAAAQEIMRQETIHFRPSRAGVYYVKIQAYEGSGRFTLDMSWR